VVGNAVVNDADQRRDDVLGERDVEPGCERVEFGHADVWRHGDADDGREPVGVAGDLGGGGRRHERPDGDGQCLADRRGERRAADLTVTGTALIAKNVTTSGTQLYGDAVTLAGNVVLTGTTVTNSGTITGAGKSLAVVGNAVVNDAISGVTTYSVSGTSSLGANVSSSGTQTYGDTATLTTDVNLSGSLVTLAAVAGGTNDLTVTGNASLTDVVSVRGGPHGDGHGLDRQERDDLGHADLRRPRDARRRASRSRAPRRRSRRASPAAGKNLTLAFSGTTAISGATFTGID